MSQYYYCIHDRTTYLDLNIYVVEENYINTVVSSDRYWGRLWINGANLPISMSAVDDGKNNLLHLVIEIIKNKSKEKAILHKKHSEKFVRKICKLVLLNDIKSECMCEKWRKAYNRIIEENKKNYPIHDRRLI